MGPVMPVHDDEVRLVGPGRKPGPEMTTRLIPQGILSAGIRDGHCEDEIAGDHPTRAGSVFECRGGGVQFVRSIHMDVVPLEGELAVLPRVDQLSQELFHPGLAILLRHRCG